MVRSFFLGVYDMRAPTPVGFGRTRKIEATPSIRAQLYAIQFCRHLSGYEVIEMAVQLGVCQSEQDFQDFLLVPRLVAHVRAHFEKPRPISHLRRGESTFDIVPKDGLEMRPGQHKPWTLGV
jgi:hypothetical protein